MPKTPNLNDVIPEVAKTVFEYVNDRAKDPDGENVFKFSPTNATDPKLKAMLEKFTDACFNTRSSTSKSTLPPETIENWCTNAGIDNTGPTAGERAAADGNQLLAALQKYSDGLANVGPGTDTQDRLSMQLTKQYELMVKWSKTPAVNEFTADSFKATVDKLNTFRDVLSVKALTLPEFVDTYIKPAQKNAEVEGVMPSVREVVDDRYKAFQKAPQKDKKSMEKLLGTEKNRAGGDPDKPEREGPEKRKGTGAGK